MAEAQVAALRNTLSFGLGHALVEARTWRGLVQLPARLVELWRVQRAKRLGHGSGAEEPAGSLARLVAEARARAKDGGPEAARAWLRRRPGARRQRARALAELALDGVAADPARALDLGLEAVRLARGEPRLRVLADALHEAGLVRGPAQLLEEIGADGNSALRAALADELAALEPRSPSPPSPWPILAAGATVLIVAPPASQPIADLASLTADTARRAALAADLRPILAQRAAPGDDRSDPLDQPQPDGSRLVRLPALGTPGERQAALQALAAESGAQAVHLVATGSAEDAIAGAAAHAAGLALSVEWVTVPAAAFGPASERRDAARTKIRALCEAAGQVVVRNGAIAGLLAEEEIAASHLPAPVLSRPGPDTQVLDDLRRELAIPGEAAIFGCVLPLADDPGLIALIEAVPSWPEEALLLVAGSGPARAKLEGRAAALSISHRIRFAGPLLPGDLLPTLRLCRALLLPRRSPATIAADPVGAPVFARALGIPLLATPEEAAWAGSDGDPVILPDPPVPPSPELLPARDGPAERDDALAALFRGEARASAHGLASRDGLV